jgi:threonine aldolase
MDEWREVWQGSERHALGSPPRETADADRYGEGVLVERLEARVAELLGKEAAVWMPSGTMAQQIALRIHAERTGRTGVAFHPYCHLDTHEERGYQALHGLRAVHLADRTRLIRADDVEALREPVAALLLELPQRDLGGRVPEWEDLVATCEAARARGAALHLDGARLWQLERIGETAALFDTVYVSFYKDLGAPAGCALAGPADVIAEARVWQIRHGGRMFTVHPLLAAAERGLDEVLPRMDELRAHTRALAAALGALDGVAIVPSPPHAAMFHALLRRPLDAYNEAQLAVARESGTWPGGRAFATEDPETQRTEVSVSLANLGVPVEETAALWAEVLTRAATA